MALSCWLAVQRKIRQPNPRKKSSVRSRCASSARAPGTMATGRSLPRSGRGPNRGCVPTIAPGHTRAMRRRGSSLTEVMSDSTAVGGKWGHRLSSTSPRAAAGTQSMARSTPAQAGARVSGVRGLSTPATVSPALPARRSSMAPMRPRAPMIRVFAGSRLIGSAPRHPRRQGRTC